MKCSDARHLIHLSVGDDNLPDEEQALGEHLHRCSECRSYNAGMVDAMQVLHDFRDNSLVATGLSVWPSVEQRIEDRSSLARATERPQRQFHGGIVALCACSLVLAFVTIVQNLPSNQGTVHVLNPYDTMTPVSLNMLNNAPAIPVNQRFVPLVNHQDGQVWVVQDSATNDVFVRAVNSKKVPVDNGLQNF